MREIRRGSETKRGKHSGPADVLSFLPAITATEFLVASPLPPAHTSLSNQRDSTGKKQAKRQLTANAICPVSTLVFLTHFATGFSFARRTYISYEIAFFFPRSASSTVSILIAEFFSVVRNPALMIPLTCCVLID